MEKCEEGFSFILPSGNEAPGVLELGEEISTFQPRSSRRHYSHRKKNCRTFRVSDQLAFSLGPVLDVENVITRPELGDYNQIAGGDIVHWQNVAVRGIAGARAVIERLRWLLNTAINRYRWP